MVDVVESVRLIQDDEPLFINRWRHFLNEVRGQLLPRHGGKFVKSTGDGMLLVFATASAAVSAALDLQTLAIAENAGYSAASAIHLRAGVNIADVVFDDIDFYGDGVNLAARLASLGSPGDTVISDVVCDELVPNLGLQIVDMGECWLKHYRYPVRAFCVQLHGATVRVRSGDFSDLRPVIAVIPFSVSSVLAASRVDTRHGEHNALGVALADDIIAALSRRNDLRVISRLSSQVMRAYDPSQVQRTANVLGASYWLGGTVTVRGRRAQARAQLCLAATGEVLWADSSQFEIGDLFNGSDSLVPLVVAEVGRAVLQCELQRGRRLPISTLERYTLYTAGLGLLHRLGRTDFERSRELLRHLSEQEPRSPAPHAMLAKWHLLRLAQSWSTHTADEASHARHHVQRALDREPGHAFALSLQAQLTALFDHDLDHAQRIVESAIEADPQEPNAWLIAAGIQSYIGDGAKAQSLAQKAINLSPLDPARFLFDVFLASAHLTAGRWADAVTSARDSVRANAMHPASQRVLTAALVLAGRVDEARQAGEQLLRLVPTFSVKKYIDGYPGRGRPHAAVLAEALTAANLPP